MMVNRIEIAMRHLDDAEIGTVIAKSDDEVLEVFENLSQAHELLSEISGFMRNSNPAFKDAERDYVDRADNVLWFLHDIGLLNFYSAPDSHYGHVLGSPRQRPAYSTIMSGHRE